jgi:hypothetical protein
VKLTAKDKLFPMFDNVVGADYVKGATHYVKADVDSTHIGLIVFNINETGDFFPGLHFWDGTEWRRMDYSPIIQPQITDLIGASAILTPNDYSNTFYDGILKVPYIGGNGGVYPSVAPIPIGNNLQLELIGGKLAIGGGEVMYRVFGTPTNPSPYPTNFNLTFLGHTTPVSIGSGASSIYLKNLVSQAIIVQHSAPSSAVELNFGGITIQETGSYAFALRLYGKLTYYLAPIRIPIYIYLQKDTRSNVLDAAEIDMVTAPNVASGYEDYSYTIVLGGVFNAGETVIISMRANDTGVNWTLAPSSDPTNPIRTSLVYWKL